MSLQKNLGYILIAAMTAFKSAAIKYGELDGEGHPHVGLMIALDSKKNPLWRCTGTLLSEKLFLTAGHCTEAPAVSATIWFDTDVQNGYPENGYPFKGEVDAKFIHTHPSYNPNAFFLHDLGVVELKKPVHRDYYGELPEVGLLDDLVSDNRGEAVSFTAVGYGLQYINPALIEANKIRYVAYPDLIQINTPGFVGDFSILVTNNAVS